MPAVLRPRYIPCVLLRLPRPLTLREGDRERVLESINIMSFLIPKTVLASIISHALETDPHECCGVLIGDDNGAEEARRIKNTHPEPVRRYEMDPVSLARAESEADAKGRKIVAIYHSHTHTQAYPSQTDVNNAVQSWWTEPYYVLISLVEKTRPIVRAFRISDAGDVTEVTITTDGDAYVETTR